MKPKKPRKTRPVKAPPELVAAYVRVQLALTIHREAERRLAAACVECNAAVKALDAAFAAVGVKPLYNHTPNEVRKETWHVSR